MEGTAPDNLDVLLRVCDVPHAALQLHDVLPLVRDSDLVQKEKLVLLRVTPLRHVPTAPQPAPLSTGTSHRCGGHENGMQQHG